MCGVVVKTVGLAALMLGVAVSLAMAQPPLSGVARVVDGDTLAIGADRVRLYGIDAPEMRQSCTRDGVDWACGVFARDTLAQLVGQARLTCAVQDHDRYGRAVALCRGRAGDIGAAMVQAGAATAYRRYSDRYVAQERRARAAGRGIWAGTMVAPETYRHRLPPPPADAPPGCVIKGNISAQGKIYHLPGQADYAKVRITPARGERWFCAAAYAEAAGWRRANR